MNLHRILTRSIAALAIYSFAAMVQAQDEGLVLQRHAGNAVADLYGAAVAGVGDIDKDGFADYMVSATNADFAGNNSGRVEVISGKTGTIIRTHDGILANDQLGNAITGLGDINQDTIPDYAIATKFGAHNGSSSGRVTVYSGVDGSILQHFWGANPGDNFGSALANAGDVNMDGINDIVIGAVGTDFNGSSSGSAYIYSGADATLLYTFWGDNAGDQLGSAVSSAGDVNMDGFDDVIIGARYNDNGAVNSGMARVYSGFDGSILHTFQGANLSDHFGTSVAKLGDVNQDGHDDVAVGSPGSDVNGSNTGSVRVFSGIDGSMLYQTNGKNTGNQLGAVLANAFDLDGDGINDLAAGAFTGGLNNQGTVTLIQGHTGQELYLATGDNTGDLLGYSVAGCGDTNGDGFAEVIAGGIGANSMGPATGSAKLFSLVHVRKTGVDTQGTQTLKLNWYVGQASDLRRGRMDVTGAAPFSPGSLFLGIPRGQPLVVLNMDLFFNTDPTKFIFWANLGYDINGRIDFDVNFHLPQIYHGITFVIQAFENNLSAPGGAYTSNALEFTVAVPNELPINPN